MVDVGGANSGLGTFIQVSSSNYTNGQSFYIQICGSPTTYYIDIRDSGNLCIVLILYVLSVILDVRVVQGQI